VIVSNTFEHLTRSTNACKNIAKQAKLKKLGMNKAIKKSCIITLLVLSAYILSYFILMARNMTAVDKDGNVIFRSAYRFAPSPDPVNSGNGGTTIVVGKVTIWNYIFYPLDIVYYKLTLTPHSTNGHAFNASPLSTPSRSFPLSAG
jgi:hypothetical protein